MAWKLTYTVSATQMYQKVLWCEETKSVVLTEEQLKTLNENFVQRLIEHHNEALKISNKEHRELVLESIRESNSKQGEE